MHRTQYPTDTQVLAELLTPCTAEVFLREVQGRSLLYLPGTEAQAAAWFSWEELNALLAAQRFEAPRFRLVSLGVVQAAPVARPVSSSVVQRGLDAGRLDVKALYEHLRSGATLVMNAVDEASPALGRLCDGLARCLLTHPHINAYASFGRTPGIGPHWDDHDVIVLQVAGSKHWQVFPPTVAYPLEHDSDCLPPGEPSWNGTLRAGDRLYLPRGWWHLPCGLGEPSLHLTVGLPLATGLDVLDWVLRQVSAQDWARQDLPLEEDRLSRKRLASCLRAAVLNLCDDTVVDRYLDCRAGLMGVRPAPCLPQAIHDVPHWTDACVVRCTAAAATLCASGEKVDEAPAASAVLGLAGIRLGVDGSLLPALQRLADGQPVRLSCLKNLVTNPRDQEVLLECLHALFTQGLLAIADEAGQSR